MKVALLYSGLVRTLEHTWGTTTKYLGRYSPDVYYYLNEPEKEGRVRELLRPRGLLAEADPVLPEHDYHTRLGPGLRAVQNDLRQMYGMMKVNELCRSTGVAYDWVVRIRPDVEITRGPEPLESLDPALLYIPRINNWFGYSDRFAIGPPGLMDVYMGRYTAFDAYFKEGGVFQMESFLAYHLRNQGIKIGRTQTVFNMLKVDKKGMLTRDPPYASPEWGDWQ